MEQRRIVLVGTTGSGKSVTGNTILRSNCFETRDSSKSVTRQCCMKEVGPIKVIDTPAIFDTSLTEDQLKQQIDQCIRMSLPGPHVFLLVIKLGRFTEDEENAVKYIQKIFGNDALLYTMVLFTHTDQLGEMTLEEFLRESIELKRLINTCGNRYHGFNNTHNPSHEQVDTLMQKVNRIVMMNGGKYFTNEIYQAAQSTTSQASKIKAAAWLAVTVGAVYTSTIAVGGLSKTLALGAGIAITAGYINATLRYNTFVKASTKATTDRAEVAGPEFSDETATAAATDLIASAALMNAFASVTDGAATAPATDTCNCQCCTHRRSVAPAADTVEADGTLVSQS